MTSVSFIFAKARVSFIDDFNRAIYDNVKLMIIVIIIIKMIIMIMIMIIIIMIIIIIIIIIITKSVSFSFWGGLLDNSFRTKYNVQ